MTGFWLKTEKQREFQKYLENVKFSKKKSESRTTTKMHYTMSYFFENGAPPNKHHLSTFFWETSACTSTLGLEVADCGESAKISKAVLPKPDPQFGHFSLTLLMHDTHTHSPIPYIWQFYSLHLTVLFPTFDSSIPYIW
mgnify:CR=1 FL=1